MAADKHLVLDVSTLKTVALLGAKPVYEDIDPRTYNLDPAHLSEERQHPPATQLPKAEPGSLQERFNQILGSLARTRPGTSIGDITRPCKTP